MKRRREIPSELTSNGSPSEIIRELQARESECCVSCEFWFSRFPTWNRERTGWMYGTFPPIRVTKMHTRYGSWRNDCRDCRAYAIELQTRFKRRNIHRDTPDVSLHSCVSPLRHPQIESLSRIVRVKPRRSLLERRWEDACLVSKYHSNRLSNHFCCDNNIKEDNYMYSKV